MRPSIPPATCYEYRVRARRNSPRRCWNTSASSIRLAKHRSRAYGYELPLAAKQLARRATGQPSRGPPRVCRPSSSSGTLPSRRRVSGREVTPHRDAPQTFVQEDERGCLAWAGPDPHIFEFAAASSQPHRCSVSSKLHLCGSRLEKSDQWVVNLHRPGVRLLHRVIERGLPYTVSGRHVCARLDE